MDLFINFRSAQLHFKLITFTRAKRVAGPRGSFLTRGGGYFNKQPHVSRRRTAYFNKNGRLVTNSRKLMCHYAKTWLLVDLLSVLPLQYVLVLSGEDLTQSSKNTGFLALRMVRLVRMVRITKIFHLASKYDDMVKVQGILQVGFTVFTIVLAMHILACFWYMAGTQDQILGDGTILYGWASPNSPSGAPWKNVTHVSVTTRYINSLYFVFNAIERGNTDLEKVFACISQGVVGLIYGAIAAGLTGVWMNAKMGEQEYSMKLESIREWMKTQDLPRPIRTRVKNVRCHHRAAPFARAVMLLQHPDHWHAVAVLRKFVQNTKIFQPARCACRAAAFDDQPNLESFVCRVDQVATPVCGTR